MVAWGGAWLHKGLLIAALPWSISVLVHGSLVVVAVCVVWSTVRQPDSNELIVPLVRLGAEPTMEPLRMKSVEALKIPQEAKKSQAEEAARKPEELVALSEPAPTLVAGQEMPDSLIFDSSRDEAYKATFFGATGNARRLVFIVDASGSLIDTLPFVLAELQKSISQLRGEQLFTVLFFQGDEVIEAPIGPVGLKQADVQTRQRMIDWLDPKQHHVEAQGTSNPLAAVRHAMQLRPQLIFLLSDNITGRGRHRIEPEELLKALDDLNGSRTKINTIQFLYHDPKPDRQGKGTLQLIAERSGGVYKFVDAHELDSVGRE
jgi:hypothetical protein